METSKYPRALAKVETTSRRQYDPEKIRVTSQEDLALLSKRGTFSLANAYPYIFDALSTLCTEHATAKWRDAQGKVRNVIERQDDATETHYRSILRIDTFAQMALNGHSEYWQNFLTQLYKMAAHPEKKVLPFTKDYNILTEPIRIDLVTEKGDKLSDADKARLANLTSRNNPTGNTGRVVLIMIEFYKPLFECLLQKNRKGEIGRNYIQIPKALQAETKATIEKLRDTGFFRGSDLDAEKVPVYEADARAIFLYMAQHDNRQGDRITIDAVDFVNSCFPSCLKFTPITNQETGEIEKKPYISKHDGFQIRSKIKKTIVTFKQMGKSGKMDGGQFIPMELDETKVQYNHEAQTYVIKVLRPKNQLAPVFKPEDIEWDAIPF